MSILSAGVWLLATSSTTQSVPVGPVINPADAVQPFIIPLLFTVLALVLARRFGVFRRADIVGPDRLPVQGAFMLLVVFFIAISTWMCAHSAYLSYRQSQWRAAGMKDIPRNLEPLLTTQDWAVLSTVPPTLGFLVMLAAGFLLNVNWLDRLGFSRRKFRPGIQSGIVGFLIAGPAVLWTLIFLTRFYEYLKFQHPTEHVLLKSLGQADHRGAGIVIAIGAAICAPFFEEFLFRGHLQTLIRRMLMRLYARPIVPEVIVPPLPILADVEALPGIDGIAPSVPAILPSHRITPQAILLQSAPWHGWIAVFLTSLIFAGFHPAWMFPPIFVLSLGLGYVYERTGNLWATITIHCLFNSLETMQYLLVLRGH